MLKVSNILKCLSQARVTKTYKNTLELKAVQKVIEKKGGEGGRGCNKTTITTTTEATISGKHSLLYMA